MTSKDNKFDIIKGHKKQNGTRAIFIGFVLVLIVGFVLIGIACSKSDKDEFVQVKSVTVSLMDGHGVRYDSSSSYDVLIRERENKLDIKERLLKNPTVETVVTYYINNVSIKIEWMNGVVGFTYV